MKRFILSLTALVLILSLLTGCAAPTSAPVAPVATAPVAPVASAPTTATTTAPVAPTAAQASTELTETLEASMYDYTLSFDPETLKLDGLLTLDYLCASQEPIYCVMLNLYLNRPLPESVKIKAVAVNGEPSYFEASGATLMAPLPREISMGETARLTVEFTLTLPDDAGRSGTHSLIYSFGNSLPIAAVYENGAWRTDAYSQNGDPFYSDAADYRVLISVPEAYYVAATGNVLDEIVKDGRRITLMSAKRVREYFFAVVSASAKVSVATTSDATAGSVEVVSYASSKAKAEMGARVSADAIRFFSEKIAPYPYQRLVVVQADFNGGMEYPQAIMLGDSVLDTRDEPYSSFTISHEIAHQWFYGVIGTDQIYEPWVDEALCDFLALEYMKSAYPSGYTRYKSWLQQGGADTLDIDGSIYDYPEAEGDYWYIYTVGSRMYDRLFEKIGEAAFYSALKEVYYAHSMRRVHGDELIAAFSEAAGEDLSEWFEKNLNGVVDATVTDAPASDATGTDTP